MRNPPKENNRLQTFCHAHNRYPLSQSIQVYTRTFVLKQLYVNPVFGRAVIERAGQTCHFDMKNTVANLKLYAFGHGAILGDCPY